MARASASGTSFTGKIICLSRGACLNWTPPKAASRLVRGSMRLLPAAYEVITATVDRHAGEVGKIYQACNFVFAEMNTAGGKFRANGFGSRALRHHGFMNKTDIELRGWKPKRQQPKGRYFAFRGCRATQRRHRAAVAHLIKAYPRRPR